jgi:CSLREA domain-containing protein
MTKRNWIITALFSGALTALVVYLGFSTLAVRSAKAAAITVTTIYDELNNDGDCSLREAITAANIDTAVDACPAGSGTDTINLPAGSVITSLAGTGEDGNLTGDYDILSHIIFKGTGLSSTIIDGGTLDRVFQIFPGGSAQLEDVTIADGDPGFAAGGNIHVYGGDLTLINSSVRIAAESSGIYATNGSTVTILDSRIETNTDSGLSLQPGSTTTIRNSTIDGNTASPTGGGGGIQNGGTLTITNSTISGNTSDYDGGGIFNWGVASLFNVTITNNHADADLNNIGNGGGVYVANAGILTVQNSIIAGNTDGNNPPYANPDCYGPLGSEGFILIQDTTGCTITGDTTGNITGLDALLGPLQDNGGSTFTHALLANSPAIDAGEPAGCINENGDPLDTDQRGYVRNGVCDMGAYEYNSEGIPTPTSSALPPANFLPIIIRLLPTSTPTATATATATEPTPTPLGTSTPMPTATSVQTATPTQSTPPPLPTPTALEGNGNVTIVDFLFLPSLMTIHVGATVVWENIDPVNHTATSDDGVWDSGTIPPSGSYQFQFTTVGTYPYHCSFHPNMTGTIIVVP